MYSVGDEEMQDLQRLVGMRTFPRDYPFTEAGKAFWSQRFSAAVKKRSRRPPKKQGASLESMETVLEIIAAWKPRNDANLDVSSSSSSSEAEDDQYNSSTLIVVHEEKFLMDFLPPNISAKCLHTADLPKPRDLLSTGALSLPNKIFLTVWLESTGSRGLPLELAKILAPTASDCLQYAMHCQMLRNKISVTKAKKQAKGSNDEKGLSYEEDSGRNHWNGLCTSSKAVEGRQVLYLDNWGLYSFFTNFGVRSSAWLRLVINRIPIKPSVAALPPLHRMRLDCAMPRP